MWQFSSRYATYPAHTRIQHAYKFVYMQTRYLHAIYHRSATCMCACEPCRWPFEGVFMYEFNIFFLPPTYFCLKICSVLNQPPLPSLKYENPLKFDDFFTLNQSYRSGQTVFLFYLYNYGNHSGNVKMEMELELFLTTASTSS